MAFFDDFEHPDGIMRMNFVDAVLSGICKLHSFSVYNECKCNLYFLDVAELKKVNYEAFFNNALQIQPSAIFVVEEQSGPAAVASSSAPAQSSDASRITGMGRGRFQTSVPVPRDLGSARDDHSNAFHVCASISNF